MWVKLLKVPEYLLTLFIILFSFLGVYTMNSSIQDLVLMIVFGVIGYGMKRADIPATPIILGMVLGKQMEEKFRQAMVISDGSLSIFLTAAHRRGPADPGGHLDHQPVLEAHLGLRQEALPEARPPRRPRLARTQPQRHRRGSGPGRFP